MAVYHKVLKYRILTPDFAMGHDLVPAMLKYKPKPMKCIGGYVSYGELELIALPPENYEKHLIYIGWRDATDDEEREIRWRKMREKRILQEGRYA